MHSCLLRRQSLYKGIKVSVITSLSEDIRAFPEYFSQREVRLVLKGTVKRWLSGRGYGFIEPEGGGDDIFVHISDVQGEAVLKEGQKVEFQRESTYKGPRAVKVELIE